MGLDGVEMIMALEEAFGVDLKEDDTRSIQTDSRPGSLCNQLRPSGLDTGSGIRPREKDRFGATPHHGNHIPGGWPFCEGFGNGLLNMKAISAKHFLHSIDIDKSKVPFVSEYRALRRDTAVLNNHEAMLTGLLKD